MFHFWLNLLCFISMTIKEFYSIGSWGTERVHSSAPPTTCTASLYSEELHSWAFPSVLTPPSQRDTAVCLPAVLQGTVEVAKRGQKSGAKKLCEALWDSCASRFHPCCLLRAGQMVYTYLDEITGGRHKASKRTCIRNGSKERDENNSQRQNKSGSLRQVSCIKDFEVNVFQQMQTLTLPFFIHLPFRRPCQSPTVKSFPQVILYLGVGDAKLFLASELHNTELRPWGWIHLLFNLTVNGFDTIPLLLLPELSA